MTEKRNSRNWQDNFARRRDVSGGGLRLLPWEFLARPGGSLWATGLEQLSRVPALLQVESLARRQRQVRTAISFRRETIRCSRGLGPFLRNNSSGHAAVKSRLAPVEHTSRTNQFLGEVWVKRKGLAAAASSNPRCPWLRGSDLNRRRVLAWWRPDISTDDENRVRHMRRDASSKVGPVCRVRRSS
jgi:hypothetical protein